ncbi:hypothetical protein MYSTI_06708 [Myxococcus stipitatus DSM 14675]|uniref:Salt-induced outer membrane protein n=1 Tax=Myxococcus stipitatus (strain DSM 14675 / JCM 12634 / Mx s8) TaxID=1278073 RepID=L7UG95_MYXSD|nr:DUF481 domain-containing protein [Myxococcus stipitatus]AGC47981.1 hypothetical protein MYSTI_06708 [Myxococcus stipitatus DSM 14675]
MLSAALLIATSLQAQAPVPAEPAPTATPAPAVAAPAATPEERMAAAAERAAAAAERAAAAAERAAEASARAAGIVAPEAAAPTTPAEGTPAEKKKEEWDITVGLGLISLTGNASTLTFSGLASAQRTTEHWIFGAKAYGNYGRSRPPEVEGENLESQLVALNAGLELRGDRRFTKMLSGYLLAGVEMDHVKSVESRSSGEGGLGILWWDEKPKDQPETYLRTDAAFRYAHETRFQYYPTRLDLPDVDLGGPRFGVAFRYGLTKDVLFKEDAEVLLSVIDSSRVLVNSQTQLSVRLTEALAMGVSFLVKHDSKPPQGKVPTDTALAFNLEVAL